MTQTVNLSKEMDLQIVQLLSKLTAMREQREQQQQSDPTRQQLEKHSMSIEAKSLELWRAVAVECFATFLYAFIVAGASISTTSPGNSLGALSVVTAAVASGFAIAAVQMIFGPVSGEFWCSFFFFLWFFWTSVWGGFGKGWALNDGNIEDIGRDRFVVVRKIGFKGN